MSRVENCLPRRRPARGFGLIELVIALAVLAILVAAAMPSFRELGRRMTVTSTTNDLVGALNMARAEAAKRGSWVAVIGPSNDWSGGWRVEADVGAGATPPNQAFGDPTDLVLQRYEGVDTGAGYAVKTKVTNGNGGDTRIVFGPSGNLVDSAGGAVVSADINVCRPDHQAAQSRWIRVQSSGEISSQRDTSSSPAPGC
jgi:type IV fimbrial biogenesis protein FimT